MYYSICDVALIFQYYYYRKYHDYFHPANPAPGAEASESTPLIPNSGTDSTKTTAEQQSQLLRAEVLRYIGAAGLIVLTGVAAWAIESRHTIGNGAGKKPEGPGWRWDAQIYGWLSAAFYLASRVPQIFKNRRTKCQGLSLALFVFAVAGNLTYVGSILLKSTDSEYLLESSSWLVGSLGTIFLDFIVLGQFIAYREERAALEAATAAAANGGGSHIEAS